MYCSTAPVPLAFVTTVELPDLSVSVAEIQKLTGLATWFQDGRQPSETSDILEETDATEPDWNN